MPTFSNVSHYAQTHFPKHLKGLFKTLYVHAVRINVYSSTEKLKTSVKNSRRQRHLFPEPLSYRGRQLSPTHGAATRKKMTLFLATQHHGLILLKNLVLPTTLARSVQGTGHHTRLYFFRTYPEHRRILPVMHVEGTL